MSSSMRGLTVFISDLRNCRARELEEKRINKEMANIRAKFKDPALSGYHKKKYICKLLYIYILGWEVDFGHLEAINLVSSPRYSEKQIGYLAMTLLLTENSDFLRLVVNSIKKDLDDHNEMNNCLALQAIANIGGKELAESLMNEVLRLLTGKSRPFVKKKASLCLLRLFRRHPDIVPASEWAPNILPIMDDPDLGVALSGTSLVLALAQQYPNEYFACTEKAVNRLQKIITGREASMDYLYYKIPVPWLQVKLLRLLQYYETSNAVEPESSSTLLNLLKIILDDAQNLAKNPQQANAQCAILFEAINLSIHYAPDSELVASAIDLLGKFISSKETNIRYLGLETMAHVATLTNAVDVLKAHQETIILSLNDKDISIRRRALDLMYSSCDYSNCKTIVSELLQYLSLADYAIREEIVLKIAILTEKFATEYTWYFDVFLQLCSIAGENISDDVWHRVVQIVTNNENLQAYAARSIMNSMRGAGCHEIVVKIGGYILGEYGHLVSDEPGFSPIEQLHAILSNIDSCQSSTRALLLTTLLKFANIFPEIKSDIVLILEQYRYVLDVELQQRAAEYHAIVTQPNTDLLEAVCDAMPPFPERESALLTRLRKKIEDTEDKRTWMIGEKDGDRHQRNQSNSLSLSGNRGSGQPQGQGETLSNSSTGRLFIHLLQNTSGVIYEDNTIQLGVKTEYRQQLGRFGLFVGNKSNFDFLDVSIQLKPISDLNFTIIQPIDSVIETQKQLFQMYNIECLGPFLEYPHITLSLVIGQERKKIELDLPISITKFMDPVTMSANDFFERWRQIGGEPREIQNIFPFGKQVDKDQKLEDLKSSLSKVSMSVLEEIDPNPSNFVGAAIFNTGNSGKIGCLYRLEVNFDEQKIRFTIRTTNEQVSQSLMQVIKTVLEKI